MEPMRISCADVIEIFSDSDLEDDFATFSCDDMDVHGQYDCRNDSAGFAIRLRHSPWANFEIDWRNPKNPLSPK